MMKEICDFRIDGSVESMLDKFEKLIVEAKKLDLSQNLNYAMKLQFTERMERNRKINSDKRYILKDEMRQEKVNQSLLRPNASSMDGVKPFSTVIVNILLNCSTLAKKVLTYQQATF